MVNRSKAKSPRNWGIWRASGAVENIRDACTRKAQQNLESFCRDLEARVGAVVTAEGPEILDTSYNCEFTKRWKIKSDGIQLGEYYTFGPRPGETNFGRAYTGRIPGYRNESVVIANKFQNEQERIPEDTVGLVFDSGRCDLVDEALLPHLPWGREVSADDLEKIENEMPYRTGRYVPVLVATPWQRQDGHHEIYFP